MSYRSKRTRAATASDAVLNKAPKLVSSHSSQPLKNQPKPTMPSASVQNSRGVNGRWGPFNPPNVINTQDLPPSSTTNTSALPPPQKSNPIWKKPINVPTPPSITNTQDLPSSYTTTQPLPQKSNPIRKKQHNVPNSPSITNTQDLLSASTTNTSAQPPLQKSNPMLDKPLNATFHPSITNTHGFPSSSTQNTSNIPPRIPPSKLSKLPTFPSTSHTCHQPWKEEIQAAHTEKSPTGNKDKEKHACDETTKEKSKIFKLRRRALLPEWLSTIDYDDKEEVLTIGGHILVQFLGGIAKEERYCPLSEKTWHELDASLKGDISKLIRDRFVIPNEEKYYTQALQRVDKVWRGYKHDLKKRYFKPAEKSIREICDSPPNGVSKNNWINLVKYWNSEKGKELSQIGKEARASLNQIHNSGGTSFANRRADYEDEHGEEMSLYELWQQCYRRKDGTFFDGTDTEEFLEDVKAKAESLKLADPSGSKSRIDIENEAFEATLYGAQIPEKPLGYGFGVRKEDIHAVRGVLRKEGIGKGTRVVELDNMTVEVSNLKEENKELHKQNEEIKEKCDENTKLLNTMTTLFSQVLESIRSGEGSSQLLDAAQLALRMANPQVSNDSVDHRGGRYESRDA